MAHGQVDTPHNPRTTDQESGDQWRVTIIPL